METRLPKGKPSDWPNSYSRKNGSCFLILPKTFAFLKGPVPQPGGKIQDREYIGKSPKSGIFSEKGTMSHINLPVT